MLTDFDGNNGNDTRSGVRRRSYRGSTVCGLYVSRSLYCRSNQYVQECARNAFSMAIVTRRKRSLKEDEFKQIVMDPLKVLLCSPRSRIVPISSLLSKYVPRLIS